jgi:O-methyltransferase / aklanonic acid methyltransferase
VTSPSSSRVGTFDRAAPTYGRVGPPLFEHFGERIIRLAAVEPGSSVLDIACGTGAASTAAKEVVGTRGRVVAVDLSYEMLREARENAPRSHLALMDANRLGVRRGAFDVAVSNFALTFFDDPGKAVAEWRRSLRPGGRVGVVVHEGWWYQDDPGWSWFEKLLERVGVVEEARRRRYQSPTDLNEVLADGGFGRTTSFVEPFTLQWANASEWWSWCWSHGFRRVLERLPASRAAWIQEESCSALGNDQPHAVLPVLVGVAHA